MSSLLRQIQDTAIDSSVDLPTLLRKCKVLAARLGSDEFKQWVEWELSGYPSTDKLPDYRILAVNSKGHFSGPFGSGLRNADIPLACFDEEFRVDLGHSYLMGPIAALDDLIQRSKGGSFQEPWNPDVVAIVGQDIYQNMNCMQAWKVIPSGSIVAALEAVRNRVLNFVLEIEAQNPTAGEAEPNSSPVPQEKVHQIFNTYITGTVQNLATGNADVRQSAKYIEALNSEMFTQLIDAVTKAGLDKNVSTAVAAIVEEMRASQGSTSFRQHYQSFMSILADHMQVLGPVVAPFLPALSTLVS